MFHASATRVFNLTTNDFFGRDDLLQGTPEGAYHMAGSIIALVMREGGGTLTAERAVGKVLHGKTHSASSTHPNTPYETRSRIVPSSTPNLSTLQHSVSLTPKAA